MSPRAPAAVATAILLAACAGYAGGGLERGVASEADVRATMGEPAMVWRLPDGGTQFAYPRGPAGYHTYMAVIDAGGRLANIANVLTAEGFALVQPGMSEGEVLQLLGPPQPQWTTYFAARDEVVWEWRYCNVWGDAARFDVLFDGTTKRVRSTLTWTESLNFYSRIRC